MLETPTRFAPAERASQGDLDRQSTAMKGQALLREVLTTVPDLVLVLNPQRQVVFANHALGEFVGLSEEEVLGLRHGEILGCVNAENTSGGCGTSEACRTCGVVATLLATAQGQDAESEARLSLTSGESLDLRLTSHLITVGEDHLTVLTLKDIAHEKRRRVLERVFFHDVLNTAGGVQGLTGLLRDANDDQVGTITDLLEMSAAQLIDEIQSQRLLMSVEREHYELSVEHRSIARTVEEVVGRYLPLGRTHSVTVAAAGALPQVEIATDCTMLGRILGNLVKNAIEASTEGMSVSAGAALVGDGVEFWVHNSSAIPQDAQLQVFQRSFSTKGAGRGLGTYSVRLFAERYLGGRVSFESSEESGTIFRVVLPLSMT